MEIKEAIILAGGAGTKLNSPIPDFPKCITPVNGRPFLFYLINHLRSQGIEKFIFSLGYKHELIEEYLENNFPTLSYECLVEKEPLGTGGALLAACYKATGENVLVVSSHILFRFDLTAALSFHLKHRSSCTLLLKPLKKTDRYTAVSLNDDNSVYDFSDEKQDTEELINAGVYLVQVQRLLEEELPSKFSFEKDYLEKYHSTRKIFATIQDEYFIDTGIPEDYEKAKKDLSPLPLNLKKTDKTWTLFLDRDGVINYEKNDDYIRHRSECKFYPDALQCINVFSQRFGRIIIVSNQRGVGKGLMTQTDLEDIHAYMLNEIKSAGGRIDAIYHCTSTENTHPGRKPNPGMAFLAKNDFPEIDFSRSVIIGNKPGDMLFGRHAGMYTVFLATTHPNTPFPHTDIDSRYDSLSEFVKAL